jgi:alpha-mannosidase
MYHRIRWTPEKLLRRLGLIEPLVYRRSAPLAPFRYIELDGPLAAAPVGPDVDDRDWPEVRGGDYWGRWMTDFVLRTRFHVPADWAAGGPLALYLPLGDAGDFSHPEALAYLDGTPYATCDRHHQEFLLGPEWAGGEHVLALHGWTGLGGMVDNLTTTRLYMRSCAVVQICRPLRDFVALARVALETAAALDDNAPERHALLDALDAAFGVLDTREPLGDQFYASVEPALTSLRAGIGSAGRPMDVTLHATGHAHIDVAWLWTLGQTRRKAERTFHTVARYMEQFPGYRFSQSQPHLYEGIRQDHPALFEDIRRRVVEGRWEPMGGMWVEADCNLTGAESLARQFLLGRSFFREHFGPEADTPVLWLPDVFGYAWALPQLIRQAGLRWFMTIKIGWSQYNRLPYDTFWWQGIDGTRVLTHFSTAPDHEGGMVSTYNANATPGSVLGSWRLLQQKEMQRDLLMAYGYGDGGGGPTREMLENIELMASFPGLPQARYSTVRAFFEALEATTAADPRLPTWNGELYLEYHRGTYTTQARNKRANRKSEFLLHDAEFLAGFAALLDPVYRYPAERFREAWRTVCLNQFHDIIPGSSITPVYIESQAQYAALTADAGAARDEALAALAGVLGGDALLANPSSFARREVVFLPGASGGWARAGQPLTGQPVEGGLLLDAGVLPAYSVTPLSRTAAGAPEPPASLSADERRLENDQLRVEFNDAGDIVRLFDKVAAREVLPAGAVANVFQAFEDRPMEFDAWDIDIYYDDNMWPAGPAESIRLVEAGPLRATLEIRRRVMSSPIVQRISLAHDTSRLDFDTQIDWRERHMLLKVAFPVDVLAPQASYEIQWGQVQRPTHRNTSWDWARFETCAQKWVDLSEGDYGVSLLNDCKYGHDIRDNVIRLSLLRGATLPDPLADLGEHRFAYSLFPHRGPLDERTSAAAYALNDPIIAWLAPEGRPAAGEPAWLLAAQPGNVIIETVKRAEDGRGLIVRLYESQRRRGPASIATGFPLAGVWETNLLEADEREMAHGERAFTFDLRPFQIMTLRLLPAAETEKEAQ